MQYSSFIGDHIPCRFKNLIEESSLRQLQFSSEDRHKTKPEFLAEFRNRAKGKNSPEEIGTKGNGKKRQGGEEEVGRKQLSLEDIFILINKGGKFTRAFRGWKICPITHNKPVLYGLPDDPKARSRRTNSLYLSSYDVDFPQFISRSARSMNLQSDKEASAKSCSAKSSAGNLLLSPSQIISRSATRIRSCHASASTNTGPGTDARQIAGTATGATSRQQFATSQVVRPASSCLASSRPASSNQRQNDSLRPVVTSRSSEQSSTIEDPMDIEFDLEEDSYVSCYREGYTFRKLREKQSRTSSTKNIPSATAVLPRTQQQSQAQVSSCGLWVGSTSDTAATTKVSAAATTKVSTSPTTNVSKTSTIVKRSTVSARCREVDKCCHAGNIQKPPKTAPESNDRKEPVEESNSIRWQINQRFHDICDPRLTVNNPSATEVAILCRIPQIIHKSSPSIPSNTNGKFGAKGSEEPYPLQLNISAAKCPVRTNAKKTHKSLFDFI